MLQIAISDCQLKSFRPLFSGTGISTEPILPVFPTLHLPHWDEQLSTSQPHLDCPHYEIGKYREKTHLWAVVKAIAVPLRYRKASLSPRLAITSLEGVTKARHVVAPGLATDECPISKAGSIFARSSESIEMKQSESAWLITSVVIGDRIDFKQLATFPHNIAEIYSAEQNGNSRVHLPVCHPLWPSITAARIHFPLASVSKTFVTSKVVIIALPTHSHLLYIRTDLRQGSSSLFGESRTLRARVTDKEFRA